MTERKRQLICLDNKEGLKPGSHGVSNGQILWKMETRDDQDVILEHAQVDLYVDSGCHQVQALWLGSTSHLVQVFTVISSFANARAWAGGDEVRHLNLNFYEIDNDRASW